MLTDTCNYSHYDVSTNSIVPTGPPLNISVIPLNSTSLYVTWKPPQGELQNGIITSYSVQLFEVETSTTQIINYVTGLSVVVNNLRSNYMYQVQVAAVTTGLGPYSVTVKSQLPEDSEKLNLIKFT